jgi:hypothetical protein
MSRSRSGAIKLVTTELWFSQFRDYSRSLPEQSKFQECEALKTQFLIKPLIPEEPRMKQCRAMWMLIAILCVP